MTKARKMMMAGPERNALSRRFPQSAFARRRGRRARDGAVPAPSLAVRMPPGEVFMDSELSPGESPIDVNSVSYTHLRAHETDSYLVCRLLLEKKKKKKKKS